MTIYGELYTFKIEPFSFDIEPKYSNLNTIHMVAAGDEDFTIFELGPVIANEVKMHVAECMINSNDYFDYCIEVLQYKGQWIQVTIREARANPTDPIDSGNVVLVIKDYVIKYD